MRIVDLKEKDVSHLLGKQVKEDDVARTIDFDCVVTVGGKPTIAYGNLPENKALLRWCANHKFPSVRRRAYEQGKQFQDDHGSSLAKSATREDYFGFKAPRPVYNLPAGPTRLTVTNKKGWQLIKNLAESLEEIYKESMPELYIWQKAKVDGSILPDWRINHGLWTQAVINKSNQFPYHYDANNCKNHLSGMACYNYGNGGGNTVVPGLDVKFEMVGAKYLIFLGQSILHGVSPIRNRQDWAMRYSIVFYSHELMTKVASPEEELKKARKIMEKRFDPAYQADRRKMLIERKRKSLESGYKFHRLEKKK